MIRRVRTGREEARYEGYDKTWRQLFNHVVQGGTADIVKTMMVRCQPVCSQLTPTCFCKSMTSSSLGAETPGTGVHATCGGFCLCRRPGTSAYQ